MIIHMYTQVIYCKNKLVIGASLSEPHTSVTALQVACTCMSGMYMRPYTENLN